MPWFSKKCVHVIFYVFQTNVNKAVDILCKLSEWIRNTQMIEYFNTEKKDLDENLALLTQKTENQNVVKETLLPPFIHQPRPPPFSGLSPFLAKLLIPPR